MTRHRRTTRSRACSGRTPSTPWIPTRRRWSSATSRGARAVGPRSTPTARWPGSSARASGWATRPVPAGLWDRIAERLSPPARRDPAPMPGPGAAGRPTAVAGAWCGSPRHGGGARTVTASRDVLESPRSPPPPSWPSSCSASACQANSQLARLQQLDQAAADAAVRRGPGHTRPPGGPAGLRPTGRSWPSSWWSPTARATWCRRRCRRCPPTRPTSCGRHRGRPISSGLLGHQPRAGDVHRGVHRAPSELAVTVEPAGGVTAPNRAPVAAGDSPA